jgi:hypothetical protein
MLYSAGWPARLSRAEGLQEGERQLQWVTRKGVRLDRTACAWLILRHLDPGAELLYVEESDLPRAIESGGLPFHTTVSEEPTARERTSFQELLAEYRLEDTNEALALMGQIVRGAETKETGAIEEGEGLRAIAKGMNALSSTDQEMVERMLPVFDALYAYCQRRVGGHRGWANAEAGWGARSKT